ncbi:MAG TPA: hypothetical protein VNA69_04490 [Thermoanaerobaculia bacterium]|nr:hypothetical protein [Thermoanaerobaculia bacterium]
MLARVFLAVLLAVFTPLPAISTAATQAATAEDKKSEIVAFNTKSHKFHCLTCSAAKRCTRNCINITRAEAKARRGVPCRICGGSCSIVD